MRTRGQSERAREEGRNEGSDTPEEGGEDNEGEERYR